jgi:UDP-N-acetyl-D-mannosaminuronic acid dehydrogenase
MPRVFHHDVCVVGGAGHVGLPLALVFAECHLKVAIYDINAETLKKVGQGSFPFMEKGGEELLQKVLQAGNLTLTTDPEIIRDSRNVVVTIGTPVDEFLNPVLKVIRTMIDSLAPYLSEDQLLILRSTVYPGTTDWLESYLKKNQIKLKLAFCPERVVQGLSIEEIRTLPQIVSGTSKEAEQEAAGLFSIVAPEIVYLSPIEAEFAKLITNAYRYIQFAAANQFYMITTSAGVDYERVLNGLKKNYPRSKDLPRAGFAAGPCLFKDTNQLSAFSNNQFSLGNAAMNINEGLVFYVVEQMKGKYNLKKSTVGLLGMAFKSDNDDIRSSLSYKLKKILEFTADRVLTTDPFVQNDPDLAPLDQVIEESDILILCAPHSCYHDLNFLGKPVIDIWGFFGNGTLI